MVEKYQKGTMKICVGSFTLQCAREVFHYQAWDCCGRTNRCALSHAQLLFSSIYANIQFLNLKIPVAQIVFSVQWKYILIIPSVEPCVEEVLWL